jgi:AraC-like DNA-binding protein
LAESLKGDFPRLAARLLPRAGMAALLRSHLQSLAEEAERLSNGERAVALMAASDMALMAFQKASQIPIDTERFAMGLYAAARTYIGRNFWNPDLGPDMIAAALGCSRAKLYRAFGGEDTSVAKTIWNERLDQVCCMLAAPEHSAAYIADIAFRGGFTDMPTFNRMFKSRFGKTPTEARPQG